MIRQQVNLYTPELRPTRQRLHAGTAGALVGIVLLILVAVMAFGRWHNQTLEQQVERLEQQNRNLETAVAAMANQVQARQPDPELEASLARITETIARRQRLLERVEGLATHNHGGFSGRLSALARQVPEDLWLTAVRLQKERREKTIREKKYDQQSMESSKPNKERKNTTGKVQQRRRKKRKAAKEIIIRIRRKKKKIPKRRKRPQRLANNASPSSKRNAIA